MRNLHAWHGSPESKVACCKTTLALKKCIWNSYDSKGNVCAELHKLIFGHQANNVPWMICVSGKMSMEIMNYDDSMFFGKKQNVAFYKQIKKYLCFLLTR
jgi:hypothetical protein